MPFSWCSKKAEGATWVIWIHHFIPSSGKIENVFKRCEIRQREAQIKSLIRTLLTSYTISSGNELMRKICRDLARAHCRQQETEASREHHHRTLTILFHSQIIWVGLILGHLIMPHTRDDKEVSWEGVEGLRYDLIISDTVNRVPKFKFSVVSTIGQFNI